MLPSHSSKVSSELSESGLRKIYRAISFAAHREFPGFKVAQTCELLLSNLKEFYRSPKMFSQGKKSILIGQIQVLVGLLDDDNFFKTLQAYFSYLSDEDAFKGKVELLTIAHFIQNELQQPPSEMRIEKIINSDDKNNFMDLINQIYDESRPPPEKTYPDVIEGPRLTPAEITQMSYSPMSLAQKFNLDGLEECKQKNFARALQCFSKALVEQEDSDEEALRVIQLNLLASLRQFKNQLLEEQKIDVALAMQHQVVSLLSELPPAKLAADAKHFLKTNPPNAADILINKALNYYHNNEYEKAFNEFKVCAEILDSYWKEFPDDVNARQFLFKCYAWMSLTKHNQCLQEVPLEQSIAGLKKALQIILQIPACYQTEGQQEQITILKNAIASQLQTLKTDAEKYYQKSTDFFKIGAYENAFLAIITAIEHHDPLEWQSNLITYQNVLIEYLWKYQNKLLEDKAFEKCIQANNQAFFLLKKNLTVPRSGLINNFLSHPVMVLIDMLEEKTRAYFNKEEWLAAFEYNQAGVKILQEITDGEDELSIQDKWSFIAKMGLCLYNLAINSQVSTDKMTLLKNAISYFYEIPPDFLTNEVYKYIAECQSELADVLYESSEFAEAEKCYALAISYYREIIAVLEPAKVNLLAREFSHLLGNYAVCLSHLKFFDHAIAYTREALTWHAQGIPTFDFPLVQLQNQLAYCLIMQAESLSNDMKALEAYREAREIFTSDAEATSKMELARLDLKIATRLVNLVKTHHDRSKIKEFKSEALLCFKLAFSMVQPEKMSDEDRMLIKTAETAMRELEKPIVSAGAGSDICLFPPRKKGEELKTSSNSPFIHKSKSETLLSRHKFSSI